MKKFEQLSKDRLNELMTAVKKLEDKRSSYRFSLFEKKRDISQDELYEKMREVRIEDTRSAEGHWLQKKAVSLSKRRC